VQNNKIESKIYERWQKTLKTVNKNNPQFVILLPPPNVTGALHIGHFLNWSIQDLLMRKAYIDGFVPKWIVGVDHAGISAEFVVERELRKKNLNKHLIGREKFREETLNWTKHATELIEQQALEFGFFFDWSSKYYTMDPEFQDLVTESFCKLYNDGLITKSQRITNWDIKFQTALSDLEIVDKIEKRKMYFIKYVVTNGESITNATPRHETIFADAALCVHPQDKRYENFTNSQFQIPLTNIVIPLIKDESIDITKGSGVLKVTPAHDKLDYTLGEKYNLPRKQIIDKNGRLFDVPERFIGKTTLEARKLIVQELVDQGNLLDIQEYESVIPCGEKSGEPIETILTEQWFLDVDKMSKIALDSVETGQIEFIPNNVVNIFRQWMQNIKPWCISRQIWWGHKIPIWYTETGSAICAKSLQEAQLLAPGEQLTQETDVLDTWFSAALWPIGTQEKFETTDVFEHFLVYS
jgi:valyl-tRNA synthetase